MSRQSLFTYEISVKDETVRLECHGGGSTWQFHEMGKMDIGFYRSYALNSQTPPSTRDYCAAVLAARDELLERGLIQK